MNGELIWVLSLLAVAIVLFATGRVRMDAVALFVIVAFALSGTLTVPEVFSGFSDPNVVLIAALFIIGDGLVRTGVATVMGTWLVKVAGNSEIKMLVLLMLTVAGLGFIGIGVRPPTPEWGTLLSLSRSYMPDYWWIALAPGLAMFLAVFGFNLLGDGLRDLLDPKARR